MSRFFKTLTEASRLRKETSGDGESGDWGPLQTAQIEIPPAFQNLGSIAPTPEKPVQVPVEEVSEAPQPVQTVLLGTDTPVVLDRRARLLPHTVDKSIVEHYRRLRTKLLQQRETRDFRSLVVASPAPQDGKTVTVLNLGMSFAMLPDFRVLVVDGDLRKGSLGKWLGINNVSGLSNLVDGTAKLEDVVLKCNEIPVHFMVSGTSKAPPGELLHSPELGRYMRKLTEHFDLILVDSPPVNLLTDAQMLAASCDGVLLIARAFSTTCKSFEKTVQDLQPFRIVGTVLNGGANGKLYGRYGGYY
jgi:capsular exopolysaccharide synthesis family protein